MESHGFRVAAEFICKNNYQVDILIHLLDDFLSIDAPSKVTFSLNIILQVFQHLGLLINEKKVEGPSTCVEFLGITLDTELFEARLSDEKRLLLIEKLVFFRQRKKMSKRDLLSLIGSLSFATKVITPGRSFLSKLISKAYSVSELHHLVRTSKSLRDDCDIWIQFLVGWNGKSIFLAKEPLAYDETFFTDAAGSLGFGGYLVGPGGIAAWFSQPWNGSQLIQWHISPKELYPILVAASLWGSYWSGKRVRVACDNASVVIAINKGYSKHKVLGEMLRALTFYSMRHNFFLQAQHIPGRLNIESDLLSRLQVEKFLIANPLARDLRATVIEDPLIISREPLGFL